MAVQHGKAAAVFRASTATQNLYTKIVSTSNWTLNTPSEFGEVRTHGQEWVRRLKGIGDWSGTFDVELDMSSNQTQLLRRLIGTNAVVGGSTAQIALYISAATVPRFQGKCHISDFNPSAPAVDMQVGTFSFVGNGTLRLQI